MIKKAAVLGTGKVGSVIGKKLVELGYSVMMGSRTKDNPKAMEWVNQTGTGALQGTFDEAAAFGEIVFLCTKGINTLDAVKMVDPTVFLGKIVIDVTNPLDFSKGMPPFLSEHLCNTYSLGEAVQEQIPAAYVVKTLNMVNCEVMVNPRIKGYDPTMFVCGNNAAAKSAVVDLLKEFGWRDIIDLGDISTARGTEMMLPVWIRTWVATQDPYIAFKILR